MEQAKQVNARRMEEIKGETARMLVEFRAELKRDAVKNDTRREQALKDAEHKLSLYDKELEKASKTASAAEQLRLAKKVELELEELETKLQKQKGRSAAAFKEGKKNEKTEGKHDRGKIKKETAHNRSQAFRNAIMGVFHKNKHDVAAAKVDAQIAQISAEAAENKLTVAKYKEVIKNLKDMQLNEEQKQRIAEIATRVIER